MGFIEKMSAPLLSLPTARAAAAAQKPRPMLNEKSKRNAKVPGEGNRADQSTHFQANELARRSAIVKTALARLNAGKSQIAVARALGVPAPTLSRYLKLHRLGGFAALEPNSTNSGRRPSSRRDASKRTFVMRVSPKTTTAGPEKSKQPAITIELRIYTQ